MGVKLNAATSVINLLKSKGEDSSFTARRSLFNDSGLSDRLGEFTGSTSQNLALFKNLAAGPSTSTTATSTAADPTSTPSSIAKVADAPTPNVFQQVGTQFGNVASQLSTPTATALPTAGATGAVSAAQTQQATGTGATQVARQQASTTTPSTITEQIRERTQQPPPSPTAALSQDLGRFDLTQIPDIAPPTPEEILARARGETGVQIAEEEKRIGKERVQSKLQSGLTNLKANFASRGLVFSGALTTEQQALRDQALAEELDLDIRFAKILGNAIDRAQVELGKEIEEIIDGAREQRQEDVAFLASVGLAADPRTGQLFPTLAAQKEARNAEEFALKNQIELAKFEFSQAKTIEELAIKQEQLRINQLQEARLQAGLQAGDTSINVSPGFSSEKVELKVREDAVELMALVNSGMIDADDAIDTLRMKYPPYQVDDQALLELFGVSSDVIDVTMPPAGEASLPGETSIFAFPKFFDDPKLSPEDIEKEIQTQRLKNRRRRAAQQ